MTKKKTTKKALLASALSLLLCFSMLLGTTYAWFTDSVTSANNIIKSGNLDVEFYYSTDAKNWKEVTETTNVFSDTLWEPGHTEVVYLKVENKGSLALKYKLGVNVASEAPGINQAGESFKLSNYILFDVIDTDTAYTDRDAARQAANGKAIANSFSKESVLKTTGDTETVALVVYLPETVGNEANPKTGTAAPEIHLGLNVFATQLTSESDSFGDDYDENAAFSVWDGTVPTEMPASLVVDGATQTVHVKDAAAFAYLSTLSDKWVEFYTDGNGTELSNYRNGAGADYYYSGRWTVSLETDIDLGNYLIDPISIVFGQNCGYSSFDGNNHVIRNINTTTGLFMDATRTTYANLVLENVTATNGALTGKSNSSITNVTVKNATISGTNYVGGLTGAAYSSVVGCKVIDSSVNASGKEAGGLIGYIETTSAGTPAEVRSNTVRNVSVYANNRAAGLVAQVNIRVKVYSNTVDTVTVGAEDLTKYAADAVVSNALAPENVYNNTVINATVLGAFETVNSVEDLQKALNDATGDAVIVLGADITGDVTVTQKPDVKITIEGSNRTYNGVIVVDGKSKRYETAALTIKNVIFDAETLSNAAYINLGNGNNGTRYTNNVTVSNCTFDYSGAGDKVAIKSYTGGDWNLTVDGCTAYAGMHSLVQVTNVEKGLTITDCKAFSKNGINLNNTPYLNMSGCEFDTTGYCVRFGVNGSANKGTFAITNSVLKSANDDGDAVIILRGTMAEATLNLEGTTLYGTPDITGSANIVK